MGSTQIALLALVVVAGLALAAALAAAESALARVGRATASGLVVEGRRGARRVEALAESPGVALAACAWVRVVCEMSAAAAITILLDGWIPTWWVTLLVAAAVTGVLVGLVVGVLARRVGRRHPVSTIARLAGLANAVTVVMRPLLRLLKIGAEGERAAEADMNPDDLIDLVERVSPDDIEDEERELITSVFELGGTLTREVMVPRTEMICLASGTSLRKALTLFVRSGFSRVPVIGQDIDDLLGVLYLKDVMRYTQVDPARINDPVDEVMRSPLFVPESKPVDDLLRQLQDSGTHIAFVVDEYGGVAGLVTIEDALEEIVGEMTDEHDPDAPEVDELGDGVYRVPARMAVDELGDLFDLDVDDDIVDTAAGLLAKALGKVPLPGASADIAGLHLQAERVEGRRKRLATVLVSRAHTRQDP